jgi:hypothetical protein
VVEREVIRQTIYLLMQHTHYDADSLGRKLSAIEGMQSRSGSKPSSLDEAHVAALYAVQGSLMRMAGVMSLMAVSLGGPRDESAIPLQASVRAEMEYVRSVRARAAPAAPAAPPPEKKRSRMTAWIIRLLSAALRWLQTR